MMATLWQQVKGTMLDFLGHTLIPAFLNCVKWVWQRHPVQVHPATHAFLEAGQPVVFMVWHGQMYTLLHRFGNSS